MRARLAAAVAFVLLVGLPAASAGAAPMPGVDVLYTTDADFDQGVPQDVNHDAPNNDQLQLDREQTFFPYVNIAASARGTMIRIDVNTGEILGEPPPSPGWSGPGSRQRSSPSRLE